MEAFLKLEMKRSVHNLIGYEPRMSPTLERALAVYDFISKKYTHFGYIYDEENKILKIPATVSIDYVMDKLCSDNVLIGEVVDQSHEYNGTRRINKIKCKATPRDMFQKESVEFLVARDVSDKLKSHRLLELSTGFGKTVCAIMAIMELKMPAIITSVNLSQQWVDRICSFTTGELGKDVIYLKTWEDIEKLMLMKHPPMGSFYVIGLDAMSAALRRDSEMLHNFYEKFGIGIQVFDEVHEHFLKIINVLVNTNVERVLFLSATPSRSDKSQDALYGKIFRDNVPSYGSKTHDIQKFNIIMLSYETNPGVGDKFRVQPRRGVHSINYFKYMFKYASRIDIIAKICVYFIYKIYKSFSFDTSKKVIIYIQSIEGIKTIANLLKGVEFPNGFKPSIGMYIGEISKDKREIELSNNIILTTMYNRAGLDLANLMMILNFIPMSSDNMLKQIRGRIREEDGWYVDITDEGFDGMTRQRDKRIHNHNRAAKKLLTYRYENGSVKRIGGN